MPVPPIDPVVASVEAAPVASSTPSIIKLPWLVPSFIVSLKSLSPVAIFVCATNAPPSCHAIYFITHACCNNFLSRKELNLAALNAFRSSKKRRNFNRYPE